MRGLWTSAYLPPKALRTHNLLLLKRDYGSPKLLPYLYEQCQVQILLPFENFVPFSPSTPIGATCTLSTLSNKSMTPNNNNNAINIYLLTIFILNIIFCLWWSTELRCRDSNCKLSKMPGPFLAVLISLFTSMISSSLLFYLQLFVTNNDDDDKCLWIFLCIILFNLFTKLCIWVFFLLRAKMVATTLSIGIRRFLGKANSFLVSFVVFFFSNWPQNHT